MLISHSCMTATKKETYLGLPKPRSNKKATKLTTHQNPIKCTICTWVHSIEKWILLLKKKNIREKKERKKEK